MTLYNVRNLGQDLTSASTLKHTFQTTLKVIIFCNIIVIFLIPEDIIKNEAEIVPATL